MAGARDSRIISAVQTYGKRLFRFVRDRVRSELDAEDIVQDVWLQLTRFGGGEDIEQLGAWLYRVARSKIIDNQRKRRALTMSELEQIQDDESTLEDLMFIETSTPEGETLNRMLWEEFRIAIEELPLEQRDVFLWNEIEGQTFEEISQRTGVKLKTLISRKRYAIQKLRTRMELVRRDFLGD